MAGAPSLPVLPAFFEFTADPVWRAIEFVSDLHLARELPSTVECWKDYLHNTGADAVFILGDLFEAWIGDDAREPGSFELAVAEVLSDATTRRTVGFMVGNRDFLVGAALLRDCGMTALADPTVLDAWGQRVLLTHGDALCLDDQPYQAFRTEVRSEAWRRAFLGRPLAQRAQVARGMRDASDAHKRSQAVWADVDAAAAVAWMHAAGARDLVHGHTHRPGSELIAPGFTRHVLSDWDCDEPPRRAQVLRLTRDGFTRIDLVS
ncbi:MAG: UDP-2,3-diacylglucosamine diphosphatase [Aquincola sp.]|nr:UDP-2,3-diacylglucosamine diphosphatase [Aquincola sp.]MDH4288889.1 UDP-2,3-diacylglucosamine diphosphatase [Aquincola sp.]MDH5330698.1 UDP-2,3-diacylglucosamine diphosphatase [Aquincola sp.]